MKILLRTMSVQFNNLALMTLNDWQQGYFILMARAWTLHTWTKKDPSCVPDQYLWEK
ncbi:unnamed protein product [Tetraodon nigroviridis]|uniref:(spotted green pufferfish) hypothetical protein n=1 Tax=Tetraodon nigroviridis TaxID=99883 RepID=Q4SCL3_TETNG|nr:unnamed protein product [Tetraodon nigroviridis]